MLFLVNKDKKSLIGNSIQFTIWSRSAQNKDFLRKSNRLHSAKFDQGVPGGLVVKNPPAKAADAGSIPGSGRSPGEGNGNPLQSSCLENSMDRGVWGSTVYGVAKESDTTERLKNNKVWPSMVFEREKKFFLRPPPADGHLSLFWRKARLLDCVAQGGWSDTFL